MVSRESAASAASIGTRSGRVASRSAAAPAASGTCAASTMPRNSVISSSEAPGVGR